MASDCSADAKTADSLPLLQFTLRELYERREEIAGEVTLTHAAYDQIGGLAGAIAAEAERAVSSLPPDAVAALPRLLRRLAEPARDGKTLTLREVSRADVASKPSEATLVDALLAARILIARTDADGRPTVRLAHDAVLASWPRASQAAQASREFYRVRAEVEDALRRWQEHGRPKDRLIQPGVPLAEAEKLVSGFRRGTAGRVHFFRDDLAPSSAPPATVRARGRGVFLCTRGRCHGRERVGLCRTRPVRESACHDNSNWKHSRLRFGDEFFRPRPAQGSVGAYARPGDSGLRSGDPT